MTDRTEDTISEEQAAAIWRRAARLQMEAAHRLEERSRSLLSGRDEAAIPGGGIRQSDLEAAAVEAGISREFVQLAQAEMRDRASAGAQLQGWEDRAATRLLGTRQRSIEISRVIAATSEEVLGAMKRILPAYPYFMSLRDAVGGHPTQGGVLVFSLPPYTMTSSVQVPLAYHAAAVDLKQVLIRVIPAGSGTASSEVLLVGDMHFGVRRNWRVGAALSAGAGAVAGGAGAAIGAGVLGAGAVVALPALAGLAAVGSVAAWGYGAAYRYYLKKVTADLEEVLQRVDVDARTGGAFGPPQLAPQARNHSGIGYTHPGGG